MINLHNLSNAQILSEYNKFNDDIGFDFETVGAIKIFSGGRCYNTTEYNEIVAEFKKELAERGFNNIILS